MRLTREMKGTKMVRKDFLVLKEAVEGVIIGSLWINWFLPGYFIFVEIIHHILTRDLYLHLHLSPHI